jgi:hypothetical protein
VAKRKNQQQLIESFRWPTLFQDPEAVDLLFLGQAFPKLVEDCRRKAEDLRHKIVHKIPTTDEAVAIQNFERGQIAALEDIIGLKQELKEWKENH